jgi:hypothetical protein
MEPGGILRSYLLRYDVDLLRLGAVKTEDSLARCRVLDNGAAQAHE